MFNSFSNQKFNEFYGYNDCAIDGYCSVDPIVYSLMEVLLYELKQITYYYIKIQELGYENRTLKDKIINYLSIIIVGYEFKRDEFIEILKDVNKDKESAKKFFINICEKNDIECQVLKSKTKFEDLDLSSIVNLGEKQAIQRNKLLKSEVKNLYEIILSIIKSASTRLIEIKSYTDDYMPEEDAILKLFNSLNFTTVRKEKLIRKINDFASINYEIHKKLHELKEGYYGKITLNRVMIGVNKGYSVLVSGQNLKDFELFLEAIKDTDINVYTHDGLIVAHAYPKFKKYKNLKGHFQMSLDSMQFDFATFKGPILIIRSFQYLLDGLYRGTIFTTNMVSGKGMSRIVGNNYTKLIESAYELKCFQNDHKIAEVKVGYDEEQVMSQMEEIIAKIKNKSIRHLIIIGLLNHSTIQNDYFKELEQNLPDDYFIISAILPSNKENILFFDSFFNSSLVYKILNKISTEINIKDFPISLFLTTCNLHTISHLFNLRQLGIKNIYLPKCTSNVITPIMLNFLKTKFDFKQCTDSAKDDLDNLV